ISLLKLNDSDYLLLFILHHIVSDGWSTALFVREFNAHYTAFKANEPSPLPELPIQYADYAVWQTEWLAGEVLDEQLAYWKEQLGSNPSPLELPTDRPRPAIQTFNGTMQNFVIPTALSEKLTTLSRAESA